MSTLGKNGKFHCKSQQRNRSCKEEPNEKFRSESIIKIIKNTSGGTQRQESMSKKIEKWASANLNDRVT